jgi:hypothetical protein
MANKHSEQSNIETTEGDFLFGSDDSDDDSETVTNKANGNRSTRAENEGTSPDGSVDGETAIEQCLSRLDTVLNHYSMGTIPLPYLAQASSFIIQIASTAEGKLQNEKERVVRSLLTQCIAALRERDFVLCKTVGADLERVLFCMLQKDSSWPSLSYREAYWCGTVTVSIGLAHQCSFLPAIFFLDKASVLGLTRQSIDDFFSYVEYHASQVAAAPFQAPATLIVPDFSSPTYMKLAITTGLSQPIEFPLPEVTESSLGSSYISKAKPAVIRRFAAEWPASQKWRYVYVEVCRF